jgi:hypothetical protein
MNFWNDIQTIDQQVKSGELDMSGRLQLPKSGIAILFHCDLENKDGRNYFGFYLTNDDATDFRKFEIRCPLGSDQDNAKYMAMQNIYNTLFGAMKQDPKTVMIDKCYNTLTEYLKTKSIKVNFECEETKYIAQKGRKAGEEVSATFLRKLTAVAGIQKVQIEIKKKESSAWNDDSEETVPF